MNESDDYKRGWYDGYKAGQSSVQPDVGRWLVGPGLIEPEVNFNRLDPEWKKDHDRSKY